MPVIAIVGAGPGMGLSIAKLFSGRGFEVALVARNAAKLDTLVADLKEHGVSAMAFTADVTDRPSLVAAFEEITKRLGPIEVLEYSPATREVEMAGPLEVTPDNLQQQIEYYLYGAVTAAAQVIPAMREAGRGTLLFTTGGGSITPHPAMGNINAAAAALRNWVLNLHQVLDGTGVYAAHVAISAWIGSGSPEADPDTIAATYWDLYQARDRAEVNYIAP
ncbi:short subunit dehydrogenase [Kribbella antiqua]|uniref:Short subunit dehydrogenase n=1 Tax=Kribbella antiqua TaxID=2512217 RepID=A0A4R2IW80_9ACTN|nr:SDR family NAD(P)-dependent oxidoreductase [Kribbella antiqua]TCO47095.1 short subunit dehydrogenase [Kribbella antiqua]